MKRAIAALFFLPALLSAKPKTPPEKQALEKSVVRAGGQAAFQRLATFSCDFEEKVKTSSGTVTQKGRWYLRMHDERGIRAREEILGGGVTVVASTAAVDGRGRVVLQELFWTFAPQWVREEDRPLSMLSDGFLAHRGVGRMSVGGAPFFPGGEDLLFFLDPKDGLIAGASAGIPPETVSFHHFEAANGFLTLPTARVYYDGDGKQSRMFKISNVAVNGYLDEKLFSPGESR